MILNYPIYPTRTRTNLGGLWDFAFLSEKEAALPKFESPEGIVFNDKQLVPGCFDAVGNTPTPKHKPFPPPEKHSAAKQPCESAWN